MIEHKERLIFILEVPVTFIILHQVWNKAFPVWVYIAASAFLGIFIAIAICTGKYRRPFVFVQLLLLFLVIRNVYPMASHYSVLPFGDPYGQYGVVRAFLQQNDAAIVHLGVEWPATWLTNYSAWPGIQLLAIAVHRVCNFDAYTVALALPWVFAIVWFLLAYLLTSRLVRDLGLSEKVGNFALVVMVTSPFLLMPLLFKYTELALAYFTTILYLIYRGIITRSPSGSFTIMFVILAGALVITHHHSAIISILYLVLFSSLGLVGKYLSSKTRSVLFPRPPPTIWPFAMAAIMFALLSLWVGLYATTFWPTLSSTAERSIEVLIPGVVTPEVLTPSAVEDSAEVLTTGAPKLELFVRMTYVPLLVSLTPRWLLWLLLIREIVTYAPAIVGFILLWRKRIAALQKSFIIYSLAAAGVLFSIGLFITGLSSFRLIFMFAILIALSVAVFYHAPKSKATHVFSGLRIVVVILLVFTSLLGLWGHRYAPVHLYDPSVSWVQAGDHPVGWTRMDRFFDKYVNYEDVDRIASDDWFVLSLIMPIDQFEKARPIERMKSGDHTDTFVMEFRELNTHSYITVDEPERYAPEFTEVNFRQKLEMTYNLIYNDNQFRLWRFK